MEAACIIASLLGLALVRVRVILGTLPLDHHVLPSTTVRQQMADAVKTASILGRGSTRALVTLATPLLGVDVWRLTTVPQQTAGAVRTVYLTVQGSRIVRATSVIHRLVSLAQLSTTALLRMADAHRIARVPGQGSYCALAT